MKTGFYTLAAEKLFSSIGLLRSISTSSLFYSVGLLFSTYLWCFSTVSTGESYTVYSFNIEIFWEWVNSMLWALYYSTKVSNFFCLLDCLAFCQNYCFWGFMNIRPLHLYLVGNMWSWILFCGILNFLLNFNVFLLNFLDSWLDFLN